MSHGGSPSIITPAGIEQHRADVGSSIIIPEVARKNEEAQTRKKEFERRRIALEVLPIAISKRVMAVASPNDFDSLTETSVDLALEIADLLIAKTGGVL